MQGAGGVGELLSVSEISNSEISNRFYPTYYDPVTGRWPSRDPIGERGGVNL
jgi:hypothetical protein